MNLRDKAACPEGFVIIIIIFHYFLSVATSRQFGGQPVLQYPEVVVLVNTGSLC